MESSGEREGVCAYFNVIKLFWRKPRLPLNYEIEKKFDVRHDELAQKCENEAIFMHKKLLLSISYLPYHVGKTI